MLTLNADNNLNSALTVSNLCRALQQKTHGNSHVEIKEVDKGSNINIPQLKSVWRPAHMTNQEQKAPHVSVSVCHLSLCAAPALWLHVREAEVRQAVVAAAVHCSIQTLESCKVKKKKELKKDKFSGRSRQKMYHSSENILKNRCSAQWTRNG